MAIRTLKRTYVLVVRDVKECETQSVLVFESRRRGFEYAKDCYGLTLEHAEPNGMGQERMAIQDTQPWESGEVTWYASLTTVTG